MKTLRHWLGPIALLSGWMIASSFVLVRLGTAADPPVATLRLPAMEIEMAPPRGALAQRPGEAKCAPRG